MSRRLPTSSLGSILVLLLAGTILVPFLGTPAAAFGERVFESNKVISGTNNLDVHSFQSVAQSFLPSMSYKLFNVTLRLRNLGGTGDAITVSIRTDNAGSPSTVILASAQLVIGNGNLGNYNLAFPSPASLAAGTHYWIVATNPSSILNGYEWHHSSSSTYASGQAKINDNFGGGWGNPSPATDMYFVTWGRESEVNISTKIVAVQPRARPDDLVTFRVYLNNTGDLTSGKVWVNDTLLPGFNVVSDTAGAAGSTTPWPAYTFVNVPNGPRSFNVTARVNVGTEPGTVVAKGFTTAFLDGAGTTHPAPATQASIMVGLEKKQLYLDPALVGTSKRLDPAKPSGGSGSQVNEVILDGGPARDYDLDPPLSRSFRAVGAIATLYVDSVSHNAKDIDFNLTLADWNGVTLVPVVYLTKGVQSNAVSDYQTFAFAFPSFDYTFPSGSRIRLTIRNLGTSGDDAVIAMNSTFAPSRLDLDTTTYVRIDSIDLRDATTSTSVWSPKDVLIVQANVSDPLGSSEILGARINVTSPSGTLIVNFTAMALIATDLSTPSAWKLFRFTLAPPLSEGVYGMRITASESNGVVDAGQATGLVRAPRFDVVKTSTATNVGGGDLFTYDIWFNNSGTGPAGRVWINDSLPIELLFLGSSDPAAKTGNYNWTWTSLGVGNYLLRIDVQVIALPASAYARNFVFLNYTDEKGFRWPAQVAFCDVAFRGPVIALSVTSPKAILHSNESVLYEITMENRGDEARKLWLNATLPRGLTYVSDTASVIGGVSRPSGDKVYFEFVNMSASSTLSFTLTATAGPALVRDSVLTVRLGLNYTNTNGFLLPPRETSSSLPVAAPWFRDATVTIGETRATAADVIQATVSYANDGNEPARNAWVNLTLNPALNFINATIPASAGRGFAHFALSAVPIGVGSIVLNASVDAAVGDHDLLSVAGMIAFTDGYGNRLPTVPIAMDSVEASAPKLRLLVTPGTSVVEAAGLAFFTIYQINAGSGVAGDVWLSLPLPASFVFVSDLSDGQRTLAGSTYTWHWSNVTPGAKSFVLQLRARPSVLDGTRTNLTFHSDYTDKNGNFRPGNTTYANVNFVAPRIDIVTTASPQIARPGETVALKVNIRNLGSVAAHNLWLTTRVNRSFSFVSYGANSSVTMVGTNLLNFSLTDLQPGQWVQIVVSMRIVDGLSPRTLIPAIFDANYTNTGDTLIGNLHSSVAVEIGPDPTPVVWMSFSAVSLGLLGALFIQRHLRVQIEEVFLVYRDGVLIYHLSRSLSADKDEDVLSGMLTAIQEFVRDAFVYGEHRELHQLDFGDYRIMIERGRFVYLAVVYSGKSSSIVRRRVRTVLNEIELAYRTVLDKWDGDMDKVAGARDLIREHLLKPASVRRFRGLPGLP